MTLDRRFIKSMIRELELVVCDKKTVVDFITRFYMLYDNMPSHLDSNTIILIEEFEDKLGYFQPDAAVRDLDDHLINEKQVRTYASMLLDKLN